MKYFRLFIGITTGNMIYYLITDNITFDAAIERSFFQGVALLTAYFLIK